MSNINGQINNICWELYASLGEVKIREVQLVNSINNKFNTDLIIDIFFKPKNGLLIEWRRENDVDISEFKIEEILELETIEQLVKYLSWNSLGSLE